MYLILASQPYSQEVLKGLPEVAVRAPVEGALDSKSVALPSWLSSYMILQQP
jgi:hypothetical protein